MQYYRAIITSINVANDNNITVDGSLNTFFVSESQDLRYLRRLVRKAKLSPNSGLGYFAILLNYEPHTGCYSLLDAFLMVV